MREIQLSPTLIGGSKDNPQFEDNEAVPVYDTSGPYGDPDVAINVQQGLAKLRQPWIEARNDCEELSVRSSAYTKERPGRRRSGRAALYRPADAETR